ncbi:MAG TPA: glycine cleavage system protein H [Candidatus Saccharimonadales bacterium]|nr:glycine cleavage system protein H [Candidatus Saccharimonadales bacterium]
MAAAKTLHYKRSHFATQLPLAYLYTPSHAWLAPAPAAAKERSWRVGLTKFATRMLGEMVDHGFDLEPGANVDCGSILGWVEGFKAISDLYCVASGKFTQGNPVLKERIHLISKDPYGAGWLYEVIGTPDPRALDVHAYRDLLDKTIDRILAQQHDQKM